MSAESKRVWRKKNPMRAAYQNLKSNAKRRNVYFDLTLEQFQTHLWDKDYMLKKGRGSDSLTIDRIRVTGGYTVDNIQLMTKSENSKKRHVEYQPVPDQKQDDKVPF